MSASVLVTPKASSICLRSDCLTETAPVSILLIFPCPHPSRVATSCWVIPAATLARRISLPSCLRRDVTVVDIGSPLFAHRANEWMTLDDVRHSQQHWWRGLWSANV